MGAAADARVSRRPIWLCADDYGISPAVDVAIRDLVVRGRINATSVMVVPQSFDRAEARALDSLNTGERRVSIGLHVTLTAPFRPISAAFEPLRDGTFLPLAATFVEAWRGRLNGNALTAEIASQVRRFVDAFGRAPDFIDGHQHVQLFPQVRDAVLEVARNDAPQAWVRQCGSARSIIRQIGDPKGLLVDLLSRRFRRRAAALGVATNPAFAGTYEFRDTADFAALFPRFLDRLPQGSVVMCHPGFVDAELERLDPLTSLREREYFFFCGDAVLDALAGRGLTLAQAPAG